MVIFEQRRLPGRHIGEPSQSSLHQRQLCLISTTTTSVTTPTIAITSTSNTIIIARGATNTSTLSFILCSNQFHFDPCRRNQWSAQQQHRHYHQDHRLHHHLDVHSNSLYSRIIANTIAQVCVMVVCISNMACIRDSYFCSARTQRSEI